MLQQKDRPFSWSWTRLKNFRGCPKRHYHIEIAKDIVEPPSEAVTWGKTFHENAAAHIGKGIELPPSMKHHARFIQEIRQHKENGDNVSVELQLAINADFQPAKWFGDDTWCRVVVDVLYLFEDRGIAAAIDWKTGKNIEPEYEQLGITAGTLFAHNPRIEQIVTSYRWIAHGDAETTKTYRREDMTGFWAKLLPEVKKMEEAKKFMEYPPRPSGLCIKHCPVESCPYHGRGSR